MRGFVGRVKENDGSFRNSLFVIEIPADVDVTTAHAGDRNHYPTPPKGVRVRRLTHGEASGIIRGSRDGRRIAYLAAAPDGTNQVFLIDSHGSDTDSDPAKRPVQATHFPGGVQGGARWHPSGNSLALLTDNGVATVCVKPGPCFGKSVFLTPHGDGLARPEALVWSNRGEELAFNRRVPQKEGTKDASGLDFEQIFITPFPDSDRDGIADSLLSAQSR